MRAETRHFPALASNGEHWLNLTALAPESTPLLALLRFPAADCGQESPGVATNAQRETKATIQKKKKKKPLRRCQSRGPAAEAGASVRSRCPRTLRPARFECASVALSSPV